VRRGEDRLGGPAAREDGGDAGADRPLADDELPAAADERHLSDGDAGDVGYRIVRAGLPAERDAEVTGPRSGGRLCRELREIGSCSENENQREAAQAHGTLHRRLAAEAAAWYPLASSAPIPSN